MAERRKPAEIPKNIEADDADDDANDGALAHYLEIRKQQRIRRVAGGPAGPYTDYARALADQVRKTGPDSIKTDPDSIKILNKHRGDKVRAHT